MLSNFVFSINIVLPIFLVLFLGTLFRKMNVMSEEFVANGNALVFKTILPTSLFLSVYRADVRSLVDGRFVAFCIIATIVSFLGLWLVCHFTIKDGPSIGALLHGAIRGNFALLGLPLVVSVAGQENSSKTALVLAFVIPLYSILATIVLTIYAGDGRKISVKNILLSICKNPIIIGIVGGLLCSLVQISFPATIMTTANYVGSLATPLALLCLGGSLNITTYNPKIKYAIISSVYKVIIQPLIFLPIAFLLGFRSYDLVVMLIMFGVPTAVSSYAMTVQMKGDSYIASAVVLVSTLLSVFSLTLFIYIFKASGWI